jgi:hypothetical protein
MIEKERDEKKQGPRLWSNGVQDTFKNMIEKQGTTAKIHDDDDDDDDGTFSTRRSKSSAATTKRDLLCDVSFRRRRCGMHVKEPCAADDNDVEKHLG